ncbi:hypothetical protein PYW07_006576 [Mythimna separata]|uniref:CHK kinase-like domain-containing protein n=1 Tax=Mythimna separata TaxID=271217 RepID=A0AAD7YWZ3_MYTSE|nr:hypothetical protein PYW07_006576 [Mythimna separata]
MAQYNFEGDIEGVNERQLEFINKVIQEQDLKVTKVVFSPVGQAGDNFVANVKRINIEGENGSLKMIVKIASGFEMLRQMTNTEIMFQNEITMYTEVLPKLVQFQKAAGVPEEEQLKYAKCYGCLNEVPNELVILEDLKELDFTMLNKFESLSDECVRSVLKNFALIHSLSYVLKKKEPETFELYKNKLINIWLVIAQNEEMMGSMQKFEDELISVFDGQAHAILKNKLVNAFKMAIKFSKTTDKCSVIQQGDAWTNNIMFKFLGDDSVQSIMIDYQASKADSPVLDLLYMIFNCTDHETRSKNYYDWLDYYHTELDKSLSNFGLKANYVYPRDQLDADLKRYGNYMFGLSLMLANVLMRDSNEASKLKEAQQNSNLDELMDTMKMEDMPDATMTRFKKRVTGLIDSFTEFGLL